MITKKLCMYIVSPLEVGLYIINEPFHNAIITCAVKKLLQCKCSKPQLYLLTRFFNMDILLTVINNLARNINKQTPIISRGNNRMDSQVVTRAFPRGFLRFLETGQIFQFKNPSIHS